MKECVIKEIKQTGHPEHGIQSKPRETDGGQSITNVHSFNLVLLFQPPLLVIMPQVDLNTRRGSCLRNKQKSLLLMEIQTFNNIQCQNSVVGLRFAQQCSFSLGGKLILPLSMLITQISPEQGLMRAPVQPDPSFLLACFPSIPFPIMTQLWHWEVLLLGLPFFLGAT